MFAPAFQSVFDSVRLNWTLITYLFIGLFVLSGFFKGWWKEAVTTFFLAGLVLLLQFPDAAQWLINRVNEILATGWAWLPLTFGQSLEPLLGLDPSRPAPSIDATNGGSWLAILLVLLGFSILISRSSLPNQIRHRGTQYAYVVSPLGAFLGGLLGGLNGFLIVNLVREYLTGTNLPTGPTQVAAGLASTNNTLGIASSGVDFRVADLPSFTVLTNPLAWLVVGFGVIVLLAVLSNRVVVGRSGRGLRTPRGYARYKVEKKGEKWSSSAG